MQRTAAGTVTEDISAANTIGPQLITKKPGLTPAFFTPLAREFLITFPFTEVIKLYLLCLLDETRPHCGQPAWPTVFFGKPSKPSARAGRLVSKFDA